VIQYCQLNDEIKIAIDGKSYSHVIKLLNQEFKRHFLSYCHVFALCTEIDKKNII